MVDSSLNLAAQLNADVVTGQVRELQRLLDLFAEEKVKFREKFKNPADLFDVSNLNLQADSILSYDIKLCPEVEILIEALQKKEVSTRS